MFWKIWCINNDNIVEENKGNKSGCRRGTRNTSECNQGEENFGLWFISYEFEHSMLQHNYVLKTTVHKTYNIKNNTILFSYLSKTGGLIPEAACIPDMFFINCFSSGRT